jgi:opacity protein-like surface antigen
MKALLAIAVLIASSSRVAAQTIPDLPRGDAWASFGWQHTDTPEEDDDVYGTRGRTVLAAAGGGVYWLPRLKLELDTSTPTHNAYRRTEHTIAGTVQRYEYSRIDFDRWGMAATQTFDMVSNAWFTPYVGIGAVIAREKREEYLESVVVYDTTSRPVDRPAFVPHELPEQRRTIVRPLAAIGFRTYTSQRVFFRSDLRLVFHGGVESVLVRFGFGLDF